MNTEKIKKEDRPEQVTLAALFLIPFLDIAGTLIIGAITHDDFWATIYGGTFLFASFFFYCWCIDKIEAKKIQKKLDSNSKI